MKSRDVDDEFDSMATHYIEHKVPKIQSKVAWTMN